MESRVVLWSAVKHVTASDREIRLVVDDHVAPGRGPLHADMNVSVRREYLSGTDFDVGLDYERLVHWTMHDSILAGALVRAPLGHRARKRGNVQ